MLAGARGWRGADCLHLSAGAWEGRVGGCASSMGMCMTIVRKGVCMAYPCAAA